MFLPYRKRRPCCSANEDEMKRVEIAPVDQVILALQVSKQVFMAGRVYRYSPRPTHRLPDMILSEGNIVDIEGSSLREESVDLKIGNTTCHTVTDMYGSTGLFE